MTWTKALTLLLAVTVLTAPTAYPQVVAASGSTLIQDYASREAQAGDLENFSGGWHGFVIGVILIVFVIWLVSEIFYHDGHADVHIHKHHPVHP